LILNTSIDKSMLAKMKQLMKVMPKSEKDYRYYIHMQLLTEKVKRDSIAESVKQQ